MTCPTCTIAANPLLAGAINITCSACCVRHVLRIVEQLGRMGSEGHADRIKDGLVEALVREVKS